MQAACLTDEVNPAADSIERDHFLQVIIAYDDLAAGRRAMRLLADIGRQLGEQTEFTPMPWSFDLLADVDSSEAAASDAVQADILILATSAKVGPLPVAVSRWTEGAIRRKRGTSAAVVALFGPDGCPDEDATPRVEFIRKASLEAGLDFFAPRPRYQFERTVANTQLGTPTVTSILSGILAVQPAAASGRGEVMNARLTEPPHSFAPAGNLPLPDAESSSPGRSTAENPRARILYADDDPDVLRLGQRVLTRSGYMVTTASDGAEALAALRQDCYDLLITDFQMPRVTGLDLIRELRMARFAIPVILASGVLSTGIDEDRRHFGCEAVLAKPFTEEQLVSTVRSVLYSATSVPIPAAVRLPTLVQHNVQLSLHRHWGLNE